MKKRILTLLVLLLLCIGFALPISAEEGTGKAYTYDHNNTATAVPDPYTAQLVLHGNITGFDTPSDIIYKNQKIYILNSKGNAVTVLDKDYNRIDSISLTKNGTEYRLSVPESMWIDNDGTILFADSGKKLVVRTSASGEVLAEYTGPDNSEEEGTEFLPYKVLTDYLGRIYVLSKGEYRGIVQLTEQGKFMSYFGSKSVEVTAGVVLDMAWRKLMSKEQIANSARYLPTEYSNMTIDQKGFLFVSSGSSSSKKEYIVKLNSNGNNVFEGTSFGDFNLGSYGTTGFSTSFNAIAVDENGFVTVADKTWNRLMQYSSEGELLYIFGGQGNQAGTFQNSDRIAAVDDRLLVVDRVNNTITVLTPTGFGKKVREGYILFEKGLFEESIKPFEEVLSLAGNYEAAYIGIGKALQLKGDYKGAMEYFKKGYSREDYSAVYTRYRSALMRQYFPAVMTALIILAVLTVVCFKIYRKKHPKIKKPPLDKRGKISYLFYCMIHPVDGYSEMRYNQKQSTLISTVLIFLWFMVEAVKFNCRGFIFNKNEPQDFSIFTLLATTVGLSAMFCLSNWLFATFFEGKGGLKNIWVNFGYGLVPMLVTSVIDVILSNALTLDESFFINYINIFGMAYTVFLIFIGLGELHQYSFKRNIFSMLATVAGVLIMVFIIFLLFNLYIQLEGFIVSVLEELFYRINVGF
ncbi:MAG: hypothetical protein IKD04_06555 [Clostridia bacterium]|nr:hypothetical protein [Clostridia bacterium]